MAGPVLVMPAEVQARNAALQQRLHGELILAPLTRGGTVPFRRLCADFGARVTVGEMAFARMLLKGEIVERARLRRAPNEQVYGVQIATKTIDEGVAAARMAAEAGADFVDLNCGCPIYEATRRGLGAVLLRKPAKLARLVAGMVEGSPLPVTVKIRTGESEKKINVREVVAALSGTGAAAVTVHGRTTEQRYKKAADWSLIGEVADAGATHHSTEGDGSEDGADESGGGGHAAMPIIGNGDVLTHYEARARLNASGCHAVMVGRGALIKPWIFEEFRTGRELLPSAEERVGIYRQLVAHMKDYFGDDAKGRSKAWYFWPWHLGFLCRYRPFPEATYGAQAAEYPLIATRWDTALPELGERLDCLPPLERLLRCEAGAAHEAIAAVLWDAGSDAEAVVALEKLAGSVEEWEADARAGDKRGMGRDAADVEG